MAIVATDGVVDIVGYVSVLVIHVGLVVFVAGDAAEYREIVGLDVTGLAIVIPLTAVRAGIDGEIATIVVEVGGVPVILVVAIQAGDGESGAVFVQVVLAVATNAIEVVGRLVDEAEVRGLVAAGQQPRLH